MPRRSSGKDQLTGGTKDVNPHYRTCNLTRASESLVSVIPANALQLIQSSADVLVIDTGIAQNVPAGRGGDQIVMELLNVEITANSLISPDSVLSSLPMDAVLATSSSAFGGSHFVTQYHSEVFAISTAPLPTSGVLGTQGSSVDTSGPTVIMKEVDRTIAHYNYASTGTTGATVSSTLVPSRREYKSSNDLTDSAGHGILIATQKLYLYAATFQRLDWEVVSAGSSSVGINTYGWNVELEYRWKRVPEAEYLQILIENTSVN